jgi:hypothetical protein
MPRDAAARRFTPQAMHRWFVVGLAVVAALATGAPVAAGASMSIPRRPAATSSISLPAVWEGLPLRPSPSIPTWSIRLTGLG